MVTYASIDTKDKVLSCVTRRPDPPFGKVQGIFWANSPEQNGCLPEYEQGLLRLELCVSETRMSLHGYDAYDDRSNSSISTAHISAEVG